MRIGQRISAKRILDEDSEIRRGELVHIFPADFDPVVGDVIRYYGTEAPARMYKSFPFDRLVLRLDTGSYFVVPKTERWQFRVIYPHKENKVAEQEIV